MNGENTERPAVYDGKGNGGDGRECPPEIVDQETPDGNSEDRSRSTMEEGIVYFIETDDGQFVKIGFTKTPQKRLAQLETTLRPTPIRYCAKSALIRVYENGVPESTPPLATASRYARSPENPEREMPFGEYPKSPSAGLVALGRRRNYGVCNCSSIGERSSVPPLSGIHAPIIKRGFPIETRCFEVRPTRLPLTDEVDESPWCGLGWRLFGVTIPSVNLTDKTRGPLLTGLLNLIVVADAPKAENTSRLQKFAHCPDVIGNTCFHSRSDAQRLVDTAEVIEREPQRNGSPVVLPFFAEGIRQAREAADSHSETQVAALDNRRADALWIGMPKDWDYLRAGDFGGRIAALTFRRGPINLDELREAHTIPERCADSAFVRSESVCRDLKVSVRGGVPQAFDEYIGGGLIALAKSEIQNQLAVPFNRDERVGVAQVLIVLRTKPLLFFTDKIPNLVGFYVPHFYVADLLRHDALAFLASNYQQFENRGVVDFGEPLNTRNAIAFENHAQNYLGSLDGQIHAVQGFVLRFGERFRALAAAESLKPVTMFSEASALGSAVVTRHSDLAFFGQNGQNDSGSRNPAFGASPRLSVAGSSSYLQRDSFLPLQKQLSPSGDLKQRRATGLGNCSYVSILYKSSKGSVKYSERICSSHLNAQKHFQTIPYQGNRVSCLRTHIQELQAKKWQAGLFFESLKAFNHRLQNANSLLKVGNLPVHILALLKPVFQLLFSFRERLALRVVINVRHVMM